MASEKGKNGYTTRYMTEMPVRELQVPKKPFLKKDFAMVHSIPEGLFISVELKEAIEEAQLTNVKFIPAYTRGKQRELSAYMIKSRELMPRIEQFNPQISVSHYFESINKASYSYERDVSPLKIPDYMRADLCDFNETAEVFGGMDGLLIISQRFRKLLLNFNTKRLQFAPIEFIGSSSVADRNVIAGASDINSLPIISSATESIEIKTALKVKTKHKNEQSPKEVNILIKELDKRFNALYKAYEKIKAEPSLIKKEKATQKEIDKLEDEMKTALPISFKTILTQYSKQLDFSAFLPDSPDFYDEFSEITCAEIKFGIESMREAESSRLSWIKDCFTDPNDEYDAVWHNKLGIMCVANGDVIAFDLADEDLDKRIVYLSHEGSEGHGMVLADNFIDYIDRLLLIGGCGSEDIQLLNFVEDDENGIQTDCDNAKLYRNFLGI